MLIDINSENYVIIEGDYIFKGFKQVDEYFVNCEIT